MGVWCEMGELDSWMLILEKRVDARAVLGFRPRYNTTAKARRKLVEGIARS